MNMSDIRRQGSVSVSNNAYGRTIKLLLNSEGPRWQLDMADDITSNRVIFEGDDLKDIEADLMTILEFLRANMW